jgi:hypothetical protein
LQWVKFLISCLYFLGLRIIDYQSETKMQYGNQPSF